MASTTLSLSSLSTLIDPKAAPPRQSAAVASSQCVSLPTLALQPQVQTHSRRTWKTTGYCRKIARNVTAMATGETPAEVATTELPEVAKTIQEAIIFYLLNSFICWNIHDYYKWDKLDDKYAVTSLGVAVVIALWVSTGMISAIDRLPLAPGVLELVGIGYTGWFVYKNLIFKPDREALIQKIKGAYSEITGSS